MSHGCFAYLYGALEGYQIRTPFQYSIRRFIVRSREVSSREIGHLNHRTALKFDRFFGSTAAEEPDKFQSDRTILNTNLTVSRLCEILQYISYRILKWDIGPLCTKKTQSYCYRDSRYKRETVVRPSRVFLVNICPGYVVFANYRFSSPLKHGKFVI